MIVNIARLTSLVLTLLLPAMVLSQITGQSITGDKGISVTVEALKATARPKPANATIRMIEERKTGRKPRQSPDALKGSTYPTMPAQPTITPQSAPNIQSNFLAIDIAESSSIPPDPMGDLSESQICIASNGRLKFYTKPTACGAVLSTSTLSGFTPLENPVLDLDMDDFFQAVRDNEGTTDPHVHYDRTSGRWFITIINVKEPTNKIMLAVSNGSIINNAASFTFYSFRHDVGTTAGQADNGMFCDYPTMGVDKHAVYLAGLIFNGSGYFGTSLYVVKKASVLSGGPIELTAFRNVGTQTMGIFCAQGVQNDDPAATAGYYVGADAGLFGVLNMVTVNNPGGNPTITKTAISNIPSTSFPISQPAFESLKPLDGGDDRPLNAQLVVNKYTGVKSIFTSHNVAVNPDGEADESGDRNAVRWYQIDVAGAGNFTVQQAGTLFDNTATNPRGYWMGSIAATGQGHALVAASVAGAQIPVNVALAGRLRQDAAGAISAPLTATQHFAAYNQDSGPNDNNQRWGDYSQTIVDPSDDMTLWTFQQYTNGTNRWGVRAVQVKAPPPAKPISLAGLGCTTNLTSTVTLNGEDANGAGYFDPGTGYAKRLSVTSTGNVAITNLQVTNATQIRFSLNYSQATPGSNQTLLITNPDCQSTTFAFTVPQGCPLPVTWVDVSARYEEKDARIIWKVANEEKLRNYEVQFSTDGIRYATIGTTEPLHAATATYQFLHKQAPDLAYYRIRQNDLDGAYSFSKVVAIKRNATAGKLQLTPNPAKGFVQIQLPEANGRLRLIQADGKRLMEITPAARQVRLTTANYPRGIYVVEYHIKGKTIQEKLVLE